MSMKIRGNENTRPAINSHEKNQTHVEKVFERLATGMKIVNARDNSSDWAISERMREQIRSMMQDTQNVQNGAALLRTAERGVDQIVDNLRTLKELALDAANDSNTDEDRAIIQKEVDQRLAVIEDIALGTKYNGKYLLEGTWARPKTEIDMIFVVDITGSMGSAIASVSSNLSSFAEYLKARGYSLNFGLVKYDDVNPSEGYGRGSAVGVKTVNFNSGEFTGNVDEFVEALDALEVAGGGDFPESGLEGVMRALEYSFRPGAQRSIIAISDATVHKKETGKSDYTLESVLSGLRENNVKLSAVTSLAENSSYSGEDDWRVLADGTEGYVYDIDGDYGEQLESEADSYGIPKYNPLHIQHGTHAGQRINVYINSMRLKDLHLENVKVTTRDDAISAIGAFEGALEQALDEATSLGAYLQRFEYTETNITTMNENVQASESAIRDADMAKEMVDYMRSNILIQSSQAMLAQANQNESSVLNLLG